jgi:hypothetical protein
MSTKIFVDARLLFLGGAGSSPERLGPDAPSALGHLHDAGHPLVVIGHGEAAVEEANLPVEWADEPGPGPGWWLVADRSDCGRARALGLRAMLVGPSGDGGREANVRCDEEARDLRDASLRILASDAMDPAGRP